MMNKEEFRAEMEGRAMKMRSQSAKIAERYTFNQSMRGMYAECVIMLDFSFHEAIGYARLGDLRNAGMSLSQAKCLLDGICAASLAMDNPTAYAVNRRRYENKMGQVESMLESLGVAA